MSIHTAVARRPSWRGIFAGLLMGLVVSMIMLALALVLSSFFITRFAWRRHLLLVFMPQ